MQLKPMIGQTWEWSCKKWTTYTAILFTLVEEKVHGDNRHWWLALNHDTQNLEMIVFSEPNAADWTIVQ